MKVEVAFGAQHWRIQGGARTRAPLGPISFVSMHFSAKNLANNKKNFTNLRLAAPPSEKSLHCTSYITMCQWNWNFPEHHIKWSQILRCCSQSEKVNYQPPIFGLFVFWCQRNQKNPILSLLEIT